MRAHAPEEKPVSLEEMLACKEQRASLQRQLLTRHNLPVVSLTVVIPGPVKDTANTRFLFSVALSNLKALCDTHEWRMVETVKTCTITGSEAVISIDAPAEDIKRHLVLLEDSHPLGRLWDFDVIDMSREPLSRTRFGLDSRRCLVCDEPAFACGRSRRHALDELLAVIENKVHAFRCS